MTIEMPDWAKEIPSAPIHRQPDNQIVRPFTPQQLVEFGKELIEQFLRRVVQALAGVFMPGISAFEQLKDWATHNIPGLAQIIDLINDILSPIFGGIDFSDGVQPHEVWETVTRVFIEPLNLLIGPRSLLAQLFGQLGRAQSINLLSAGEFASGSITSDAGWSIDADKSRTSDGSGAAKIVADGTQKAIHTEDVIAVAQEFTPKVFIAHEGYVGSGVAVRLQVIPHRGDVTDEPVDVATYTPSAADVEWPGVELSGVYEPAEGVTGVQVRILVTETVTGGTFYFDDASASQNTRLKQDWVDGLPDVLQNLLGRIDLLIETIINTLRGTVGAILNPFEELVEALTSINPANILGSLGAGNIAEAIQDFLDHLVGGLVGQHGTGASLPDLFNTILQVSSNAAQGAFAWLLAGISTNKPVDKGLLPSGDANYPYSNANTWLPVTQNATLAITYRAAKSEPIGVIGWLGKGSQDITACYANVRKIDKATGARVRVHHSPNLVSLLPPGDTTGWVYYQLDEALPREVSDEFEVQVVIVGSGTHYIRGYDEEDDIPDHPYANVKSTAAVRDETTNPDNPPLVIAKSAVVRSAKVPWIELAVDTGSGSDHYDPMVLYLGTNETTIAKPKWANAFDLFGVGGSGAGRQASLAQFGEGGWPGKPNGATFIEGEHFEADEDVIISLIPGTPGAGGTGVGGNGGDTVFSFETSTGVHELRCEGGAGGDSLGLIGKPIGRGYPDPLEYNGEQYLAGGHQKVPSGGGIAPGGGGNGGDRFLNHGGPGAPGGGWVKFYRRAVDAPTPEPVDTTPPTPPTTEVVRKSFSTITVRAVGSTDE